MKKKLLAVLLATGVAATTLLGGSILVSAADDGGNTAQARTLDEIKEDGKIKIGVFSDKNPFGYVDETVMFRDTMYTSGRDLPKTSLEVKMM